MAEEISIELIKDWLESSGLNEDGVEVVPLPEVAAFQAEEYQALARLLAKSLIVNAKHAFEDADSPTGTTSLDFSIDYRIEIDSAQNSIEISANCCLPGGCPICPGPVSIALSH